MAAQFEILVLTNLDNLNQMVGPGPRAKNAWAWPRAQPSDLFFFLCIYIVIFEKAVPQTLLRLV